MHLFWIISCLLQITCTYALECYQCSNVSSTNDCHTIAVCQDTEHCYTHSSGIGDQTTYMLGCKDSDQCHQPATTVPSVSIVGRAFAPQTDCSQCCAVDGCNKKLCSSGTQVINEVGACADDPNFDCATVSSTFGICNDIPHAKTVCRKYCGLCDVVDGAWTDWSNWSNCDVTCGMGHLTRTRACIDPAPAHGGIDCVGNSTEHNVCSLNACPVHAQWSLWSLWSGCSVTCGVGMQRRARNCTTGTPKPDCNPCFGDSNDVQLCYQKDCTVPVIFSVTSPTAHLVGGSASEGRPAFTKIITNIGNGFNNATGFFHCPVAGIYHFSLSFVSSTGHTTCLIEDNFNHIVQTVASHQSAKVPASTSTYLTLRKGETVNIYCYGWEHVSHDMTMVFNGALISAS